MPVTASSRSSVLLALCSLITPFLGRYIAARPRGRAHPLDRCSVPWSARSTASRGPTRPASRAGGRYTGPARVQPAVDRRAVPPAAAPGVPAAQPDRRPGRAPGPGAQHRRQLHHQHELAELRRRGRDGAPHPGRGSRSRTSCRPRSASPSRSHSFAGSPADVADHRQLLGGRHPRSPCTSCCRSPSSRPSSSCGRACPRRWAGPATVTDLEGAHAVDLPRADRVPGGDQGAGHERRRHRQRELGAPVREPDRRSPTSSSSSSSSSSRSR